MLSRGKWNFPNEYGKSLIINAEKEREGERERGRKREREKERERGTVFGSIPEEGEFVGSEAETALGTRYGKTTSRKSITRDEISFSFLLAVSSSIKYHVLSTSMY